jgi:hypothetical protein
MRPGRNRLSIICVAVCILFFYVLPTLIERSLVGRIGAFRTCVFLGDALGCLAIAFLTRWAIGFVLYAALAALEAALLYYRVVDAGLLLWLVDAVPTLLLCALVVFVIQMRWGIAGGRPAAHRSSV